MTPRLYCLRILLPLFLLASLRTFAQTTFPTHGLHKQAPRVHAFRNATIVVSPGVVVESATLIVRDGIVENLSKNASIPADALIHDLQGAYVLPGFIDPYTQYGIRKEAPKPQERGAPPRYTSSNSGPYAWNEAIRPEFKAAEALDHDPKKAAEWLEAGFTALQCVPDDGIFRGSAALLLPGKSTLQDALLLPQSATALAFRKGSSQQSYPESLMGAIALIRQTYLDARWYAQVERTRKERPNMPALEQNLSLQAINEQLAARLPILFECGDWQDIFRAARIAAEFGISPIFKTGTDAYKRVEAIQKLKASLIVGLDFPEAYELGDPAEVREIPLSKLMDWENAPRNPALLSAAKIPYAFTSAGLKKPKQLWEGLGKAIRHGLKPEEALAALTTEPAKLLGLDRRMGTLDPGKLANFVVYEENPFRTCEPVILEVWTAGSQHVVVPIPETDPRASYSLQVDGRVHPLLIAGTLSSPKARIVVEKDTLKAEFELRGRDLRLSFPEKKAKENALYTLVGVLTPARITGTGSSPDGRRLTWSADRTGPMSPDPKEKEKKPLEPVDVSKIPAPRFPALAYGHAQLPTPGTWLIRNVTAWTNTDAGIQEGVDVILSDGKIQSIGKGLPQPPNAKVIDGTGKHLSPGIIDEHSHIAIRAGVNEGSHAVTAEVRIGDVLDSEDIDIYRQLSGGVTAAQLLHGSANPIGGQSQIIKLRWGALPEDLKFKEAPGFIKFALGENVKQSNWGDQFRVRYPQTRAGVEQMIRDAFQAAVDYKAAREAAAKDAGNLPPFRTELQMETLLEIMEGKRFITCHSYVQSEILMLMRLAESFGFKVNTFTHVLEGYKIAAEIKAHGASASSFSDWWAYKMEVYDAVPYNAALLHGKGVNVCLNSDDAEMARRLNQEAAKAVKYGGVSEQEALKMVTLNPAKALHVDQYVGTLEKGKTADVVLWSGHPLSIYTQADMTFIDGCLYFSRSDDAENRVWVAAERQRILAKMAATPSKDKRKFNAGDAPQHYHCETLESDYNHE